MTSGQQAEDKAANYLLDLGYELVDRNWRTRFCEIDIIARKDKTLRFVEVKYRLTNNQGSGIDYITVTKLRQMHFAAELWLSTNSFDGDVTLSAIEVSGRDFTVTRFVTDL